MRRYIQQHPFDLVEISFRALLAMFGLYIALVDFFYQDLAVAPLLEGMKSLDTIILLILSLVVGASILDRVRQFLKVETALRDMQVTLRPISTIDDTVQQIQSTIGAITITEGTDKLFQEVVNTLTEDGPWRTVRIFAPVGLWARNEYKSEWLRTLANYCHHKKVHFQGVFGLPLHPIEKNNESIAEHQQKMRYVRDNFKRFEGAEEAVLHYIPPLPASPGFGVIIFESNEKTRMALAFATELNHWVVDTAIGVQKRDDVFRVLESWFDKQIFAESTKDFVLQDRNTKMSKSWEKIMTQYYKGWEIPWQDAA